MQCSDEVDSFDMFSEELWNSFESCSDGDEIVVLNMRVSVLSIVPRNISVKETNKLFYMKV